VDGKIADPKSITIRERERERERKIF